MTTIAAALDDLLNDRDTTVDDAIRRHFTDDYRQRTDGEWSDRAGFADHISHLRTIVARADIRVLEELEDGRVYADRHEAHIRKTDGTSVVQEVYLFGRRADDGRFAVVNEVTHMLDGTDADRAIGSAR